MDMPMPSGSALPDKPDQCFKSRVLKMNEYHSPPQCGINLKLNQNESPFDLPREMKEQWAAELANLDWMRYPDYEAVELKNKIADYLQISPSELLIGNGSNALLYAAACAVLAPGDAVLLTPPVFSLYQTIADIFQADIIQVFQNPDFTYDKEKIINAAKKAKLIFICSPNNPTGKCMPLSLLKDICRSCGGLVLLDEAYAEFCGETAVPLIRSFSNLVVLRTFSKALGLAGLRLGMLAGHPFAIAQIRKAAVPYSVNVLTQWLASRILENDGILQKNISLICSQRDKLFEQLKGISGVCPIPSRANFITCRVSGVSLVIENLLKEGIAVRDMRHYPMLENCFRVSIGLPEENQIFIESLKRIIHLEIEKGERQ